MQNSFDLSNFWIWSSTFYAQMQWKIVDCHKCMKITKNLLYRSIPQWLWLSALGQLVQGWYNLGVGQSTLAFFRYHVVSSEMHPPVHVCDYVDYCSIVVLVCKDLLNEAQAKLVSITHDKNQYKSILESLVEQVTIICCLCMVCLLIFRPPPNVLWPEAYCLCPVRPCIRPCVHVCVPKCC